MTTLDPADGHVVLINTFTVDPDRAEDLLAALSRATEASVDRWPGFVSANFHMSADRRHVTNYAQWRSDAELDAMLSGESQGHLREIGEIAESYDPIRYTLRAVYPAPSSR